MMETTTLDIIYNDTSTGANNYSTNLSNLGVNRTFNSTFRADGWTLPTWFTYTMFSVNCPLFIIGIFGNFSILLVLMRLSDSFIPYNLLIIALAISDMLSLTLNSVLQLRHLEIVDVDFTSVGCQIFLSIRQTVANISLSIIVLICIERFVVVTFPLKVNLVSQRKVTIISLCVCVVFGLITGILPAALYKQDNGKRCRVNVNLNPKVLYILNIIAIIIPIIIVLTLTPIIIYKLYQRHGKRAKLTNQERNSGIFQRSVMLISVVVAYIVLCGIPITFYLIFNLDGYETDAESKIIANMCIVTCFQVNHSTNFLVYGISNAKFRKQLLSQFEFKREHLATEGNPGIPARGADIIEMQNLNAGSTP